MSDLRDIAVKYAHLLAVSDYSTLLDMVDEIERLQSALEVARGNAKRWEELAIRYKREFVEPALKQEDDDE